MGREAQCRVRFGGRSALGTALLEAQEIRFRGDFSLTIPLGAGTTAQAAHGELSVAFADGVAIFELGAKAAEAWALAIRYPRGRLDKLGIKPESVVSVLGIDDASFADELRGRVPTASVGRLRKASDVVLAGMSQTSDLTALPRLRDHITQSGAVWVVWPKGRKTLREDDVRAAALQGGLVDVKVASFSETHSALKLVIPLALRAPGKPAARRRASK